MIEIQNKFFKIFSSIVIIKISIMISIFLSNLLLARYLKTSEFGIYNYILVIINIFSPILDLGISQIMIRELNNKSTFKNEIMTSSFIIRGVGSFLSIFIFYILLIKYDFKEIDKKYLLIIIPILILRFTEIFRYVFEGMGKFIYSYIPQLISSIFSLIFIIFWTKLNKDFFWFIWLKLIEEGIMALLYLKLFLLTEKKYKINLNRNRINFMIKDAIPLLFSGIAMILYLKVDQLMIGKMLGIEKIAFYSVGVRIAEMWYFIPTIIASIYYPKLIRLFHEKKENYFTIKKELYFIEIFLSIFFAVVITLFSSELIRLFYGEKYIESYKILNVYVWAGVPFSLLSATSKVLILNKKMKEIFYRSIITGILNIILNYFFIKKFGVIGAAYSTFISYCFIIISLLFIGCKEEIRDIFLSIVTLKNILTFLNKEKK
mgnify:CR=1 FL=1